MTVLRALGWDHPRCRGPMVACARAWNESSAPTTVEWSFRSLEAFGDEPVEQAAADFDLVVVDHPFCGRAQKTGCLIPLDELVEPEALAELAADAAGPSHASYTYGGHQWGLATDAACHVSALGAGLEPPSTWSEALDLARAVPTALPLSPPHAISSLLTLGAGTGEPVPHGRDRLLSEEVGAWAFHVLTDLHGLGLPEALAWEPPDVLARLEAGELEYVPLTYGFVTYRACRFVPVPGLRGGVLGGAGLAVSAASSRPLEAAAFAVWASGSETQRHVVAPAGGQPGSRSAWLDPELDAAAGGFFSSTLPGLETAWVRPREAWWPDFQLDGGRLLVEALAAGREPADTTRALNALYAERAGGGRADR